MDGPNRIAKSMTGRKEVTGPVRVTPNTLPSQPHWKTATRTPKAAPTDSRFMIAALRGISRLRDTIASRVKDSTTTTPVSRGSLGGSTVEESTKVAVGAPPEGVGPGARGARAMA